jgi:hypothetical protein
LLSNENKAKAEARAKLQKSKNQHDQEQALISVMMGRLLLPLLSEQHETSIQLHQHHRYYTHYTTSNRGSAASVGLSLFALARLRRAKLNMEVIG